MRRVLFIALVGCVSMLNAQKLERTALKISDLKGFRINGNIQGFGSDENNYYVYAGALDAYFIINKKLTTVKKIAVPDDKKDRFLRIALSGDDVVVFMSRYKKSESKGEVIMRNFNKTTGKLKSEKVVATFSMKKSDFWGIATAVSPDKSKTAFLFLLANKKDKADSYYIMVMNETFNVEWSSEYDLDLSNESFSVKSFVMTDKGELYLAFFSHPENVKKAANKKSYIDLVYLTEETNEKMTLPLEQYEYAEISLKPLKSGDIYLAALLTVDEKAYASEFLSIKISGHNFNDEGSHSKTIEDKNTHIKFAPNQLIPFNYLYFLNLEKILELDNGNIAVVCEQAVSTSYLTQDRTRIYVEVRGSVSTFFVNGKDASVEEVSVMGKTQISRSMINAPAKFMSLSIHPFAYGDKVAYLFNDEFKRYATPAKHKATSSFKKINGNDACIVLNTQESGEKAKIDVLTGNKASGRLCRQILFQEDDRLILFTHSNKESYIETLSLP